VIAETSDLPTKFAKVVVTDDRGRFLIPDLPKVNYSVWCAATGWSTRQGEQHAGNTLALTAVPRQRSRGGGIYPGMYWYFDDQHPGQERISGPAKTATASRRTFQVQEQWVDTVKNACQSATRSARRACARCEEFGPRRRGWRVVRNPDRLTQMALGLGTWCRRSA